MKRLIVTEKLRACDVSYLVCVNVGGTVALAAVVTPKITQKPPGQAGEVPLVQRNFQFRPFASWTWQAVKRVWRSVEHLKSVIRCSRWMSFKMRTLKPEIYRHLAPAVVSERGSAGETHQWRSALLSPQLYTSREGEKATIRMQLHDWVLGGPTAPLQTDLWVLVGGTGNRGLGKLGKDQWEGSLRDNLTMWACEKDNNKTDREKLLKPRKPVF